MRVATFLWFGVGLAGSVGTAPARAQEAANRSDDEIVVTALKREQTDTSVGMSITAAGADTLRNRGIDSVADLPNLVPGLTLQDSNFASTSFTLRGVGFFNSDLSTPPAVTVYVDEAPLPYPAMTRLAAFDLERVEVLKGPQGTLFGQNATGGAVNYIAAAPSSVPQGGTDVSFGRFNRLKAGGFVSGPLGGGFSARLAVQGRRGDGWQQSITRPGDTLGRISEFQGRATLDWEASDRLSSRMTVTLTHDGSERPAGQFVAAIPPRPALAVPGLLTFPAIPTPRSADWSVFRPDTGGRISYASDTTLVHARWRTDFQLGEGLSLTSLTSYAHLDLAYAQDANGTPFSLNEVINENGRVSSFFQELRVSGRNGRFTWLGGLNYTHDRIMSAFSIGSALAPDLWTMFAMRLLTGLGLGGVLPNMLALVHETSPPDRARSRVTMLGAAIPLGGATLGLLLLFVPTLAWRTMFWCGGIAPLLVAACCQILLPRMIVGLSERPVAARAVRFALMGEQRAGPTMLLWVTIFCVSVSVAMMTNWLPSLMTARHFPGSSMGSVVMVLTLGGATGGIAFGMFAIHRSALVQRVAWGGMIASLLLLLGSGSSEAAVAAAAFGMGFFLNGGQSLLFGIATDLYPNLVRGTGTGFTVGVGRLGATLGPLAGGAVLARTGQADTAFWTLAPLLVLSLVTGGLLWGLLQRRLPADAEQGAAIDAKRVVQGI